MDQGQNRDEPGESIVRIPRARPQVIAVGLGGLALVVFGLTVFWLLMKDETAIVKDRSGTQRTTTRAERWPIALPSACLVLMGVALPILWARTSSLEIRPDGLKYDRKDQKVLSWDQVRSCHWNPYRPGVLDLNGPEGLVFIKIPPAYSDQIEAALRRVGKWPD